MKLHQIHYSYLDPDEAKFITLEIIKAFTIAGQPAEMVEQIKELESYWLDGINFIAPLEQQYWLIEDFAYNVISKM